MRAMAAVLALIALFVFPWQVAVLAIIGSALLMPLSGLALGVIADIVYYVPGSSFMPLFSLYGLAATALVLLVQRFVKTRIME